MDAHALEIDDDSFDVTGSQFGVMLVADQPLALREMVRVTKPGGRVLLDRVRLTGRVRSPAVLPRRAASRRPGLRRIARRPSAVGVPGVRTPTCCASD